MIKMTKTVENGNSPPRRTKIRAEVKLKSNKLVEAKKSAAKRALKKAAATIKSAKRVNVGGKIVKPKPLMSVKTAAPPPRRPRPPPDKAVRKPRTSSEAASGVKRGWKKLYVGDLRVDITVPELTREFEKFGRLNDVWLARNPPGFGFIDYFESRDAARAVRAMDGAFILDSKIKVEFAKTLNPKAAAMVALVRRRGKEGGFDTSRRPAFRRGLRVERGRGRGMRGRFRTSPHSHRMSDQSWSPPHRSISPFARRRMSPRRSPSPFRRGGFAPPPLPPLPPMYDPFDPRFREMAMMGGWSRGRSPPMLPPGPPLPRFRSRSPTPPRYRGRPGSRRYTTLYG